MANNKVRLPYQIIFLPNLILYSSLYLFLLYHLSFFKKRYKPKVDSGCFKSKLKKEKRRTDEDKTGKQTRDRRRSDGKKNMDDISSIFDSKGVGCAKYEGISVNPCNPLVVFGVESHKWCAMLACIFFLLYHLSFFKKKDTSQW